MTSPCESPIQCHMATYSNAQDKHQFDSIAVHTHHLGKIHWPFSYISMRSSFSPIFRTTIDKLPPFKSRIDSNQNHLQNVDNSKLKVEDFVRNRCKCALTSPKPKLAVISNLFGSLFTGKCVNRTPAVSDRTID